MIKFYGHHNDYGWMSNFHQSHFKLDGYTWPTVEHFFQASKFEGTDLYHKIRKAKTPGEAKKLGQSRGLRPDWEKVKIKVMHRALRAKFQISTFRSMLKFTGDELIEEVSPYDYVWGTGKDGKGKNLLGKLLMRVRTEI